MITIFSLISCGGSGGSSTNQSNITLENIENITWEEIESVDSICNNQEKLSSTLMMVTGITHYL